MGEIVHIQHWKDKRLAKSWYETPNCIGSLEVPVSQGSHCLEMTVFNNQLLAIFETPDKGIVTFKIDIEKGICEEITI